MWVGGWGWGRACVVVDKFLRHYLPPCVPHSPWYCPASLPSLPLPHPACSNEVFFSNRAAAHAALEQWDASLEDARRAVAMRPGWAKAHQRLGTAFFGLKL